VKRTNNSIDKKIPDLQNQTDKRKITVDKVGVKGIKYPIIVSDRLHNIQHTVADINLFVELPHYNRGTHMSRFVEVLNHYHQDNIVNNLEKLLQELRKTLKANAAFVELSFPYFIQKRAPISGIYSYLNYECFFKASLSATFNFTIGVKVPVTTLCPCSREISDYGAHNQRSEVSLFIQYNEFIWLEELIELVENTCSCEIFPLLKRPDEKYVTEKAYDNPMFVEDIVRDLATKLQHDKRIVQYEIESENFESIHNHSAYAYKTSKPGA
jgi:GTP cyclohydrolase IB